MRGALAVSISLLLLQGCAWATDAGSAVTAIPVPAANTSAASATAEPAPAQAQRAAASNASQLAASLTALPVASAAQTLVPTVINQTAAAAPDAASSTAATSIAANSTAATPTAANSTAVSNQGSNGEQHTASPDATATGVLAAAPEQRAATSEQKAAAPEQKAAAPEQKAATSEQKAATPEQKAAPEQKTAAPSSNWTTYTTSNTSAGFKSSASSGAQVLQLSLSDDQLSQYGVGFKDLTIEVTPETESRLHVKVRPAGEQRWEVPESIVPRPGPAANLNKGRTLYDVKQPSGRPDEPFALTVVRKSTGARIFDTTGHPFLFKPQYIELTTTLPRASSLYGIGETSLNTGLLLPRNGSTITLWNRDSASAFQNTNLYGSHPFYLQINKDGSSHGVFLLNSNGMDITINETQLTYRIIGGLVDLYFFMGPTPEAVIRQYHQVIGAPIMPPFWTLGLHQSKWGYPNISTLEQVAANYSAAGLPLESLWVDIEYMQSRFRTMTFDEVRYPVAKMREFVKKLHANGQSWVPILDPAVSVDSGYSTYLEGTKSDVWIKDYKGETYVGQVWPGMSVYPDYLSAPNITKWLKKELKQFHDQVPFDGLWLDMCEPSNFCTGMNCKPDPKNVTAMHWLTVDTPKDYVSMASPQVKLVTNRTTCQMVCEQPATTNSLAHPPYTIKNGGMWGTMPLSKNIIHPTAKHADGATEYDAHNLYGTAMAMRHYQAAAAVTKKRPFILTRSTFPGAGRFTGHWTGDNAADWANLYLSIGGMINTNFWGMSMAGADICGYVDMTQDNRADPANKMLSDDQFRELCNRWTSAGAFYPFSRNHMIIYSRSHEFYRWPDVTAAAKKAYGLRYQLLTYYYSGLFMTHTRGGTLARPLLFTDPSDINARNATQQWMIGEALLISPVISHNTTTVKPYFTSGNWYSAWDYDMLRIKKGRKVQLDAPYGHIPVHLRGGAIVPMQKTSALPMVTRDVRYTPVTLVVTLPSKTSLGGAGVAAAVRDAAGPLPPYILEEPCAAVHRRNAGKFVSCGLLYMDQDQQAISANNTLQVWYSAITGALARSGTVENLVIANGSTFKSNKLKIKAIHILGVPGSQHDVASASVYGKPSYKATYDAAKKVVKISGIDFDAGRPLTVDWWLKSVPRQQRQQAGDV